MPATIHALPRSALQAVADRRVRSNFVSPQAAGVMAKTGRTAEFPRLGREVDEVLFFLSGCDIPLRAAVWPELRVDAVVGSDSLALPDVARVFLPDFSETRLEVPRPLKGIRPPLQLYAAQNHAAHRGRVPAPRLIPIRWGEEFRAPV